MCSHFSFGRRFFSFSCPCAQLTNQLFKLSTTFCRVKRNHTEGHTNLFHSTYLVLFFNIAFALIEKSIGCNGNFEIKPKRSFRSAHAHTYTHSALVCIGTLLFSSQTEYNTQIMSTLWKAKMVCPTDFGGCFSKFAYLLSVKTLYAVLVFFPYHQRPYFFFLSSLSIRKQDIK